jgi:hypothetical protein
VGNKQKMLIACIGERAKRLPAAANLPVLRDRKTLEQVLASFGTQLVREVNDPIVIGVFRLAIAEAVHSPEVARTLNSIGRKAGRVALGNIMAWAKASELLKGSPADLAQQFFGLLWGDFNGQLAARRPTPRAIAERACAAAADFLQRNSLPIDAARARQPSGGMNDPSEATPS